MKYAKPKSDAPGYLLRLQKAENFRKFLRGEDASGDFLELLYEYALPYIEEPVDRDEAKQALINASEDEYREFMAFIASGGAENPTVPPKSETS
jgi:hypothetical protein